MWSILSLLSESISSKSGVISVIKIHVTLPICCKKNGILQFIWPCVQNTHPPTAAYSSLEWVEISIQKQELINIKNIKMTWWLMPFFPQKLSIFILGNIFEGLRWQI